MKPEEQIARCLGLEYLMVTARGTSALWLALRTLNPARRGVLVPANICEVVIAAIFDSGLEPIYVDIDPIIGNFDLRQLEQCTFDQAGVLVAVHNFGTPLPMPDIRSWADSYNIFVIEDVCNALGAMVQDSPVGTWGDAAIYSFGANKILDVGHGGVLAARDPFFLNECRRLEAKLESWNETLRMREIAFQACLRTMRQYQELKDPFLYRALYQRYKPALVARAAVGTDEAIAMGLENLARNLELRRRRAEYYRERLVHPALSHRPYQAGEVCWRYICHLAPELRDGAVKYLLERNLPVSVWYPAVDRLFRERPADFRLIGADRFEETVLNLWVDPKVSNEVVDQTITSLLEYLAQANFAD